jgi:hypothetical protein
MTPSCGGGGAPTLVRAGVDPAKDATVTDTLRIDL